MASIGKQIVYIEGRIGNSQAKYQQAETLTRCFSLLTGQGMEVKRFRADSASYQQKVVELAAEKAECFYNQRGSAERTFNAMNNDFGWAKLPCSFLNENTAFMIITAIYANLYQYLLSIISMKLSWVKENFRLKKIIFRFITLAAKWIKTSRRYILKLYTKKDYSPLLR